MKIFLLLSILFFSSCSIAPTFEKECIFSFDQIKVCQNDNIKVVLTTKQIADDEQILKNLVVTLKGKNISWLLLKIPV